MPVPTEIPPMSRAKVPNKLIGSKVSKPSIATQELVLDDEMPLKLCLRDRKQINGDSKSRVSLPSICVLTQEKDLSNVNTAIMQRLSEALSSDMNALIPVKNPHSKKNAARNMLKKSGTKD
ncbi:hypothetical protein Ddc_18928 [Ditylenchus destructor]|nr:hypothetical protein Ddc_18928 [Ditylenchus destructor]